MAPRLASGTSCAATRAGRVLVVGGGPAGLECALTLARRGYEVTLAEAGAAIRRPAQLRGAAAGPRCLAPRDRLPARPAQGDEPMSRSIPRACSTPRTSWISAPTMWCWRPERAGSPMLYSPMEHPCGSADGRRRLDAGRHRRRHADRRAGRRVRFRQLLHGRRDQPSIWRGAGLPSPMSRRRGSSPPGPS